MPAPFRVAHNSPFVADLPSFAQCADALQLHATTASILDDVRFLIAAVRALPDTPTPKDRHKIQTTARWMHDRIQKLPPRSPEGDPDGGHATHATQPHTASARRPSIVLSEPVDTQSTTPNASPQSYFGTTATSPGMPSTHSNNSDLPAAPLLADDAESPPDPLYEAVRQTALVYTRAILQQKPLKDVVEPAEFARLWDAAWHVSVTSGKGMVGVLMWVVLGIVSSARDTPHDRFIRSMLSLCTVQMSLEGGEAVLGALGAAVRLNVWLAGGQPE